MTLYFRYFLRKIYQERALHDLFRLIKLNLFEHNQRCEFCLKDNFHSISSYVIKKSFLGKYSQDAQENKVSFC